MTKSRSTFITPDGYAVIRASMLVPDRALGVEVSVLINGRAVKWALEGDILDRSRLDRIMSFKIRKVLIRADDEPAFRRYVERAFDDTLSNESSSAQQKIQATSSATDLAVQDILNTPEDKDTYNRSQAYFERLGALVASLPGGLEEILARPYAAESHDHLSHSLRVAALSVALASRLGLVSKEKDRTALVTASYLHDAALETAGVARAQLHSQGAVRDRVAEWKTHPMEGARLFQGKDFVNSRVLDLIAQHEEIPNGDGFPQGLTKAKMDPLAIVLSLVNRFEDYFERHEGKTAPALDDFIKSELGRYDLDYLTHLKAIVLQARPLEPRTKV